MIISQLSGGLGNQMFQYAAGRALAALHNTEFKIDNSWFENIPLNDTPRRYELDIFNITVPAATPKELKFFKKGSPFKFIQTLHKMLRLLGLGHRKIYHERHYQFDPKLFKLAPPLYLEGYFQSYLYFKDIDQIIRKEFTLKSPLPNAAQKIAELMKKSESVCLHIRRGDYVTLKSANQFHGTCSPDYYHRAINIIMEKMQNDPQKLGNLNFFIFSDDTNWVKQNIKIPGPAKNIHYVSELGFYNYEELALMSYCKHNVIANSSFSWWGAWLNNNPNKTVIAPKHWFNDQRINTNDLIPQDWTRI